MEKLKINDITIDTKVNDEHKIAVYEFHDSQAKIIDLFAYDHKLNKKYSFSNNEECSLEDISSCGTKIITTNTTFDKRKRKTKIWDIKSGEVLLETNDFFAYEVIFTSIPHLLIVRGDIRAKKSKNFCFVYDIDKKEVVHIMKGDFCLVYAGENSNEHTYIYPSKKKDEIVVLNLLNLEEKIIKLQEKSAVHRVLPLKTGGYLAINSNYDALRLDDTGNIIWKRRLDFDTFYYAPDFFEMDNEIFFPMYENIKLNLETSEIIVSEKKVKGLIHKYFDNTALSFGSGIILDLKNRETSILDIEQFNIGHGYNI